MLRLISSEVVTLTFPPAYVIPPTPTGFSPHPALTCAQEFCNFKRLFEVGRGAASGVSSEAEPGRDGPQPLRKDRRSGSAAPRTAGRYFPFGSSGMFRVRRRKAG